MIRNKTLHAAARILLGAFIAAYAMTSLHVNARTAQPAAEVVQAAAIQITAEESETHEHCQEKKTDPAVLLCKFHCQNAMQTLDYPAAGVPPMPDAAVLVIPLADLKIALKPLVDKALRPDATHHGGAPPPFARTSRLRL